MNISEFCIRHPVATTLMSVALVAGGIFAYLFLPVAALPRVEFPVINVSASLPGASPDTMANAVATPLIKQPRSSALCLAKIGQRSRQK
jgi:HAE1 family hydrophobic/amphiphilic exporter-1